MGYVGIVSTEVNVGHGLVLDMSGPSLTPFGAKSLGLNGAPGCRFAVSAIQEATFKDVLEAAQPRA